MFRVCVFLSIVSVAACISYPEVTTVDEAPDAPDFPDGSAERIALVEELGLDGGDAAADVRDGGVLPHPERDARADTPAAGDTHEDAGNGNDPGNGKGKPPKKKD
jgi:hypothetical protein